MDADEPVAELTVSDDHFAEQFPLSPLDDYMIHQTPDPIRVLSTSDPRAYERYWMVCHDPAGEVLIATGGSFYPNLDRAEAFAIVNHEGRHTTVRGFRRLGVDRADLRIGPIAPRIIRGMRWWRYVLEPNEWGVGYQIDFRDTTRQMFREPLSDSAHGFPAGRRNDVTTGFESSELKHSVISLTATRSFVDGATASLRHADRSATVPAFPQRMLELVAMSC
jgi:hypothetical protein